MSTHSETIVGPNFETDQVFLKIDFKNAFNTVRRDHMLACIGDRFPELLAFLHCAYRSPAPLFWGNEALWSKEGVQQGDPMGPFLFCLAIHGVVTNLNSTVNCWYLDDGSLVGDVNTVSADFERLSSQSANLGLSINPKKCGATVPRVVIRSVKLKIVSLGLLRAYSTSVSGGKSAY